MSGEIEGWMFVIADLHCGSKLNYMALWRTVKEAIEFLKVVRASKVSIAILGDIHEHQKMYETQVVTAEGVYQSEIAAGVILTITKMFRDSGINLAKLVLIGGNHDWREHEGISYMKLLSHNLDLVGLPHEVYEMYTCKINDTPVGLVHSVSPRGGSYVSALTPKVIAMAKKIADLLGVEKVIVGHSHLHGHYVDATFEVVALPSFKISQDPKFWVYGGLLTNGRYNVFLRPKIHVDELFADLIEIRKMDLQMIYNFRRTAGKRGIPFESRVVVYEKGQHGYKKQLPVAGIFKVGSKRLFFMREDLREILKYLKEGKTVEEISELTGRKRWFVEAARRWLYKNGFLGEGE